MSRVPGPPYGDDSRIGLGVDAHRFDPARALVLGGVTVPGSPGLAGHSDADVLSHAVADAVLGAAAMGDLGEKFPPTERWRDVTGLAILAEVARELVDAGWDVVNVDATIVAEAPRLVPHRAAMTDNVSSCLDIPPESVSIKATTTDGMGFTGRGEGIAAFAVARVRRRQEDDG